MKKTFSSLPGNHFYLITLFPCFLLASCGSDEQRQFADKQSHLSDDLVKANRTFVKEESQEIDDFIKRHKYEMKRSLTGLRYSIQSDHNGEPVKKGDVVEVKYKIWLLNGTLCYSSDSTGNMVFEVGKSEIPNGIHEAVMLMRRGDEAQLVMPAHLAYGLSGDQQKIPLESTIYCTLKLIDIKKSK